MLPRFFLSLSLLAWALWAVDSATMLILLAMSLLLLYWRGAQPVLMLRSCRLLLWIFIPMIIFHGIFTPGIYVQSPVYLPFTIEGLNRAMFLCLHILLIFFAALTCFRLLHTAEWVYLIQRVPWLGQYCLPYLLLIPALRVLAMGILAEQRLAWQGKDVILYKRWQHFPSFLTQSLAMMLIAAKKEAGLLWTNWSQRVQAVQAPVLWLDGMAKDMFYTAWFILGWGHCCPT